MILLEQEINSYDFCDEYETKLLEMLKVVQDAKYFAGDRAYKRCSTAYGLLGVFAKKKGGTFKTRYEELKKTHFSKTPSGGDGKDNKNNPPKP